MAPGRGCTCRQDQPEQESGDGQGRNAHAGSVREWSLHEEQGRLPVGTWTWHRSAVKAPMEALYFHRGLQHRGSLATVPISITTGHASGARTRAIDGCAPRGRRCSRRLAVPSAQVAAPNSSIDRVRLEALPISRRLPSMSNCTRCGPSRRPHRRAKGIIVCSDPVSSRRRSRRRRCAW